MKILAVGLNVFREAIRDKILYNIVFFALILIIFSGALSTLTVGERGKIIIDVGLASINLFGLLMAIFLGVSLVHKEIDRRTAYTILTKPIWRFEFLLGKYLGLTGTLFVNTLILSLFFAVTLWFMGGIFSLTLFLSIVMIFVELMLITAVALLFSTFTTMTLSAIFTLAVYITGHLSADTLMFSKNLSAGWLLQVFYYTAPNLENLNFKRYASHAIPIPFPLLLWGLLYGAFYILLLLGISIAVFNRRDFK